MLVLNMRLYQRDQDQLKEQNQPFYTVKSHHYKSILNNQSIQRDLDFINNVGTQFNDLTSQEIDPSQFLLNSRSLYENIERIIAKPFKTKIDVFPYDLPRELTELRLQLQKAAAQKQIIDFKNEIIWKLMNEKSNLQLLNIPRSELEKQTTDEINEWAQLVDNFQNELNRFHVVCCYCGIALDPAIINLPCKFNRPDTDIGKSLFQNIYKQEIKVPCQETPPSEINGTDKHFFSKPLINRE